MGVSKSLSQVSAILLSLVLTTGVANSLARPKAAPSAMEASLRRFLQTYTADETTKYCVSFRDLSGDGTPEVIVHLMGRWWCGSGGCLTLIMARDGDSWRVVTKITITRAPIRVLRNTSNGWHNISVWVGGGGVIPGYEAELCFDGTSDPTNPSIPPARPLKRRPLGRVVMSLRCAATALYP